MTVLLKFVDAAFPDTIVGGPYDGVCFYIGGDTPHPWTVPELHARPERFRLPVWVRSDPNVIAPDADAARCLSALINTYAVPHGSLVALDTETTIDPSWVAVFCRLLISGGFPVIDYGSQSDVIKNQVPTGYYWGADWTSVPHLAGRDVMTQYISLANIDVSMAEISLPFWDTRPPIKPKPQEEFMAYILDNLTLEGPAYSVPVPAGKTEAILYADPGIRSSVPPEIRVGTYPTWNNAPILKPTWPDPARTPLPANTTHLTVARTDTGDVPVTLDFA